ncbi:YlxR family protein [Sanguibacter sp. A247]|uniref:YlxR family protein n=1 Tax=unclassified Sanguibacter TaxID=2645534 RepID=UPI003FD8991C
MPTVRRARLVDVRSRAVPDAPHPQTPVTPTPNALVATRTGPVRTCVGCRRKDARDALVRLVVDVAPGATPRVVVDVRRSLPGRGAWVHPDPHCHELAEKRRAVVRALRIDSAVEHAWQGNAGRA